MLTTPSHGVLGGAPLLRKLAVVVGWVGIVAFAFLGQRAVRHPLDQRRTTLEHQNVQLDSDVRCPYADAFAGDSDSDEDMEAVVSTAQQLYVRGDYEAAAELVEPATRVEATAARAWRILGAAACFQQDARDAARAAGRLDMKGQAFVRYVCARNGIKL